MENLTSSLQRYFLCLKYTHVESHYYVCMQTVWIQIGLISLIWIRTFCWRDFKTQFQATKHCWTANFTLRKFHPMWRIGTNTSLLECEIYVWSISITFGVYHLCSNFTFLLFWTCEELVRCEELVPNFHKCDESVPNPHTCEESKPNLHICEKMISNHHMWKIGIKTHTCVELVANPHTCEKLVPNYHTYEELVLNRHRCQWQNCEELKSNAKCSRFGGGGYLINVRNTRMYWLRVYFSQSVRYWYEICDVLVPFFHVLWGIRTNSSQCEIYEVWNLRFNKAHDFSHNWQWKCEALTWGPDL